MARVKHVVIACAGFGSRLGKKMPKCLVQVKGRTLLSYLLEMTRGIEDVRVVVGFHAEDVIAEAFRCRSDVKIVCNDQYATTNCAYSYWLGTRDLTEPFVVVDGDMAVHKEDFLTFIEGIEPGKSVVGVCEAKTTDAVFVTMNQQKLVTAFARKPPTDLEWCGIAYFDGLVFHNDTQYIFNELEPGLPLPFHKFRCYEVDTPEDEALMNKNFHTLGY